MTILPRSKALSSLLASLAPVGLLLLLGLAGCREREPVRLGFMGGLTGHATDLGVAGRDGALLAVEEVNRSGGVDGRPLLLRVEDDRQEPAASREAFQRLRDWGVAAVIGPMTSEMAMAAAPLADESRIVLLSPTAKTDLLAGKDDHFLRITPVLSRSATLMAEEVFLRRGLAEVVVAMDTSNLAFTQPWLETFRSAFVDLGGRIAEIIPFESSATLRYGAIAAPLLSHPEAGVLLLAAARDTALICQQLRKAGSRQSVFTSMWSFTPNLIQYGGRAVEGITLYQDFDQQSRRPAFEGFAATFQKRFGYVPSFAAVNAYDAVHLAATGLARNPDPALLKETLLSLSPFQGLQTTIRLDRYGDGDRQLFPTVVRNRAFDVVDRP